LQPSFMAHPACGGTALSRSACALPLNLIWDFETTSLIFKKIIIWYSVSQVI
jgi:hypothetical protein